MSDDISDKQILDDEGDNLNDVRMTAIFSYVPFMVFVPLLGGHRNNKFVRRHARQGLLLLIIEVISLLFMIPTVNQFFWSGVFVACLFIAGVGAFHCLQGEEWKVPYIGHWIDKYKSKI